MNNLCLADMEWSNNIKSTLLARGWGDAITLLECLIKNDPSKFSSWLNSGSTIELRRSCERFRNWSIYSQRLDPMPFENDVSALDSVFLIVKG
jgi:hypothetical protein